MKITQLTVNRPEAERLIHNQIQKGKAISGSMSFDDATLDIGVEKVDKWETETRDLLLEIFDSEELADEFTGAAQLYSKGPDMQAKLYYTGSRITYKNYALEEIQKRLSFYEESTEKLESYDFWSTIHPAITGLCKSRFETEHYADCVETAFKHINNEVKTRVKKKTGKEFDGASLMNNAFSPANPIISLDDLSTETGKNIQQGYMQIFAGSMTGIRNPKAHDIVNIDAERAVHFLFLASLLMSKLDEAV